ncbi:MAG: BlaI/MecI/CopY family transcriptional regulator [Planctomycetia bacterium]|nr:BlaI/MecI/CopY family transcriptional regulator [Planctomycetia bacterium]
MSPDARASISDAEREVMLALWDHGAGSVREVHERLTGAALDWARSTVITLLQRLEKKGYVASDKSGFAFVFRASVSREELLVQRMGELADDLCDGQWAPLLLAFTERQKLKPKEIAELQKLVEQLSARLAEERKKR